jgi:hypothetical protein
LVSGNRFHPDGESGGPFLSRNLAGDSRHPQALENLGHQFGGAKDNQQGERNGEQRFDGHGKNRVSSHQ